MGRSQIFTKILLWEKKCKMFYKELLYSLFLSYASRFHLLLGGFLVCLFIFLFADIKNFVLRLLQKWYIFKSVHSKISKVSKLIIFLWIRKWSKLYIKSSSSGEVSCGPLLFSWCLSFYAQQYRETQFRWICFI